MYRQCKECQLVKLKKASFTYSHKGRSEIRYVDETGRQWRGRKCADCLSNSKTVTHAKTKRICRICNKTGLTPDRYFNCIECVQRGEITDEVYTYVG